MKYPALLALLALIVFTSVEMKETAEIEAQTIAPKPIIERLETPPTVLEQPPSVSQRLAWKSKRAGI